MATLLMGSREIHTCGTPPAVGDFAPDFTATKSDLSIFNLSDLKGQCVLLNVYPSIDTAVCFDSVNKINQSVGLDITSLCISMDLPFALQRIQVGEALDRIMLLSDFRNREFGEIYGLTMIDGPVSGLLARAIFILDSAHRIVYQEIVTDVTKPVQFQKIFDQIQNLF